MLQNSCYHVAFAQHSYQEQFLTDQWNIAQINVGTSRYPMDDERMQGFAGRLDDINALAGSNNLQC